MGSQSGVAQRMRQIRDDLVRRGVRATTDPRRVDPPCVLVVPTATKFNILERGGATVQISLHVLGPQPGGVDTMDVICDIVADILDIDHVNPEDGEFTSYRTDTGDPWPTMTLHCVEALSWIHKPQPSKPKAPATQP